jgi:hypothetical protein
MTLFRKRRPASRATKELGKWFAMHVVSFTNGPINSARSGSAVRSRYWAGRVSPKPQCPTPTANS